MPILFLGALTIPIWSDKRTFGTDNEEIKVLATIYLRYPQAKETRLNDKFATRK